MNKYELSMMVRAGLGNSEAKQQLVKLYEQQITRNTIWLAILSLFFLIGLGFNFTGGIFFWFVVLFASANRVYLHKQLDRAKAIEAKEHLHT